MKKLVSTLLAMALALFLLSGCSTLEVLEELYKQGAFGQTTDSSSSEPSPPSSVPTPPSAPASNSKAPSFPESAQQGGELKPADPALTSLRDEIAQNGKQGGLAFLGYASGTTGEADLRSRIAHSDMGQQYPFLQTALLLLAEGDELYAIVPPNEQATVTVYASGMSETYEYADDLDAPLAQGQPGESLLVLCNFSDIYSNVLICVDDGGSTVFFRPQLSMEDGRLAKDTGMYDFTPYEEPIGEDALQAAAERLAQTGEVRSAMEQGMSILYTGETEMIDGRICLLFALGTNHSDYFVREFYYAVHDDCIYGYDAIYDVWYTVEE